MEEHECSIQIGGYTIERGWTPGNFWIYNEIGEGGEFSEAKFEAVIADFFKENF